jgi:putative restriction endonuclease
MDPSVQDAAVRKMAFDWLERQSAIHGDVLPRTLLSTGFEFQGRRVPLVSAQGIFKPAVCPELPLTITTSPNGPYEDGFADEHTLLYRYRGTDPMHRDNVGLREAMRRRTPLIYLFGLIPGKYLPIWPVFIVGDNPGQLCFSVRADDRQGLHDLLETGAESAIAREAETPRRQYITAVVQRRLHQTSFRERVLSAYGERCTLCQLRHRELLDASHIIPDHDPRGEPQVTNGLALCKIHHTAYDRNFLGINADGVIHLRPDLLKEKDGPMLQHGLKELHGLRMRQPRRLVDRPDRDALAERFSQFLDAGGF